VRRRAPGLRLALLALAGLLGGCVYYNGMYNTNRLAKSARKAERDGRPSQARSLWGQVVTRADSLIERHPQSKYANQAMVLRGLALARLNQCPDAVGPLGRLDAVEISTDFTEEAALALGRCYLELGDAALADLAFSQVINSEDPARRREARVRHARALRMTGRYEEALALLRENPDPRAREDFLLSLAGAGHTEEALTFADSLLALKDSSFSWDSVVAAVGARDPHAASRFVNRLRADPRATPEVRARRLYEDGVRLAAVDSAAALARFRQVADTFGTTGSGGRAHLRLLAVALSAARSVQELGPIADSLASLAGRPGESRFEAAALGTQVARVKQLSDSARPEMVRGDLRGFLAAEAARDTLHAPQLATGIFRRLAEEWPVSPYAPKALLAAELLDPSESEEVRIRLDSLYHDSPYLALIRGEDAPGYRDLEDSLQAFAATQPGAVPRRGAAGVRGRTVLPSPGSPDIETPREDSVRARRGATPDQNDAPKPRRELEP
jgi:tetratricopeptide (TPR) repeat protein